MKIRALYRFTDMQANTIREVGSVFTVAAERGAELVKAGFVEEVAEAKKPKKAKED